MSENVFPFRACHRSCRSTFLPLDLLQMDRAALEALDHGQLVDLVCRLRTIAVEATERLALDSTNSSRPPSSDPPFGPSGDFQAHSNPTALCDGGFFHGHPLYQRKPSPAALDLFQRPLDRG
jgi:hypothetical protein